MFENKKTYPRSRVGTINKAKEAGAPDYIKFNLYGLGETLTIKNGQTLSLESKQYQLNSLQQAVAAGKLSEEDASKARKRIEKIPEWVRFEIVLVNKDN